MVNQVRSGRSVTYVAVSQKVSRRAVYDLMIQFKEEGVLAYKIKKPGRSSLPLNPLFVKKVVEMRKETDYGSSKILDCTPVSSQIVKH
jgi:hypothetical protein